MLQDNSLCHGKHGDNHGESTDCSGGIAVPVRNEPGFLFLRLRGFKWVNSGEFPFLTRSRRGLGSRRGPRYGRFTLRAISSFRRITLDLFNNLLVVAELELPQKLRLMTRMT